MKKALLCVALAAAALPGCASASPQLSTAVASQPAPVAEQQTIYVVRHLQKGEGADPSLTSEGAAAAERLADLLAEKRVSAIFATPTRRAMETAGPLAKRLGIPVQPYDARNPDALVSTAAAATGNVLVVGHSNTVGDLIVRFGGSAPAALSDDDYGTVFIVEPGGNVTTFELN